MLIEITFYKIYEPGENQANYIEQEFEKEFYLESIPRYKDQIIFDNKNYYIKDVIYSIDPFSIKYLINAERKVPFHEIKTEKR